jgi:uncharacterized phage protein gp47/JayE
MAWTIRSLADASARVRGAFRQYLPGTDTSLANNFVTVTVKVLAGMAHEFELRMAYLAKQMFLTTATGPFLVLHCAEVGIYRKQASPASGGAQIADGSNALATPLTTYPAGIRLTSGNVIYTSTAPATSDADGNLSLTLLSESKGAAANREADGLLQLADPLLYPDLPTQWQVSAGGIGGGADIEQPEDLRARGLQRKRNPPGSGALADYERFVRAVPGVLNAWAFRGASPGSIFVFFLFAGRDDFIPEPSDVAVVQAAIDAQRLIRVDDSVAVAPTARPIDITINGLQSDTPDIRVAIETAISATFLAKCRPGIAVDTFTVFRSWIDEVISGVTGETSHDLALPAGNIVLTNGQFPTLGTVTYGA